LKKFYVEVIQYYGSLRIEGYCWKLNGIENNIDI
jgi:hypothetical protein